MSSAAVIHPEPAAAATTGWRGALDIELARRGEATVVSHRIHRGPLQIQRGFYPEGPACCHLYLLHPPGGLVSGDHLDIDVRLTADARALITTPAATKVYRCLPGQSARQTQRLRVAGGAQLEWLPQESILFDEARAELATEVHLDAGAAFVGWEILSLGRAAGDAPFRSGRCRQRIEIYRSGQPVLIDRTEVTGGGELAAASFGLRGQPVLGTFVAAPVPDGAVDRLREALAGESADGLAPEDLAPLTALPEALVCRYLGPSAPRARAHFIRLWSLLRPLLLGRPPCPPRIWST